MKKIAIVALAAAATFITSCDIERMPYDKYTEDKIMEDKDAAVDVLLNGCYAKLKTASEHLHYCGEFPGDNVCKDKPTTIHSVLTLLISIPLIMVGFLRFGTVLIISSRRQVL